MRSPTYRNDNIYFSLFLPYIRKYYQPFSYLSTGHIYRSFSFPHRPGRASNNLHGDPPSQRILPINTIKPRQKQKKAHNAPRLPLPSVHEIHRPCACAILILADDERRIPPDRVTDRPVKSKNLRPPFIILVISRQASHIAAADGAQGVDDPGGRPGGPAAHCRPRFSRCRHGLSPRFFPNIINGPAVYAVFPVNPWTQCNPYDPYLS